MAEKQLIQTKEPEKQLTQTCEPEKPPMSEQKKQSIMERLWLTYYNDTLYAQGVITEEERNKMRVKIKTRSASMER